MDKVDNSKNIAYWQKRLEDILIHSEKTELEYEKRLIKLYTEYKLTIERQIEQFYQKYSEKNQISLADAKKRLNPKQLKAFKEQQQIYLDKIESLIAKGASLDNYTKTLEKLSGRAAISRLQELQNNINSELMILTGEQEVSLTNTLDKVFKDSFTSTLTVLDEGLAVAVSLTTPATDIVRKALKSEWSGNNYSTNIWNNKAKLTNWLNTDLPRHFTMGSSIPDMTKDIKNKLDTNYRSAQRLARTEVNFVSNQATMEAYTNSGVVEQFMILATLDERTSEICQEMNKKIFDVKDSEVAVNTPPFHPNCRTTTIPYFEEYREEYLE